MNERKFRPELRVLAALAVAIAIAVWFTRSRAPSAPPAGTGPGIRVDFAATGPGPDHGRADRGPAVIGVDGTTPPSLPQAAVREAVATLGLGMPVVEIPDSDTAAQAVDAIRRAGAVGAGAGRPGTVGPGGEPRFVMITARSGESAVAYAERFGSLYSAAKGAGQNIRVGGYLGQYNGSFLRTFVDGGGSRADFVDFSFHGGGTGQPENGQPESEQRLLRELDTVSAEITDARSVIAARSIGIHVGPWDITSRPASVRFTSFAAMWDADLLGRILAGGGGSMAGGAGLLYDGDGTAPRAYQPGSPTPLYAAIGMFTGAGLFPRFGTPLPEAAVTVAASALPGVDAFASASPDEVVVVNTSSSARTTVLRVSGDTPLRAVQWRLGMLNGAVSGPVSGGAATSRNGSFALSLPSGSVTTVVVTAAGPAGAKTGSPVTVSNASTGQCLAGAGSGAVATARCDGGVSQEWRLTGTTLVNEGTGRCLAADSSGRVRASACDTRIGQDWYNLGSRLVSASTGRCLNGNGTTEVYALACDGASQQNWVFSPAGG